MLSIKNEQVFQINLLRLSIEAFLNSSDWCNLIDLYDSELCLMTIVADGLVMLSCATKIYVDLSLDQPHGNLFSCGFYN